MLAAKTGAGAALRGAPAGLLSWTILMSNLCHLQVHGYLLQQRYRAVAVERAQEWGGASATDLSCSDKTRNCQRYECLGVETSPFVRSSGTQNHSRKPNACILYGSCLVKTFHTSRSSRQTWARCTFSTLCCSALRRLGAPGAPCWQRWTCKHHSSLMSMVQGGSAAGGPASRHAVSASTWRRCCCCPLGFQHCAPCCVHIVCA